MTLYECAEIASSLVENMILIQFFGLFFKKRFSRLAHIALSVVLSVGLTVFVLHLNSFSLFSYVTITIGILAYAFSMLIPFRAKLFSVRRLSTAAVAIMSMTFLTLVDFLTLTMRSLIAWEFSAAQEILQTVGPARVLHIYLSKTILLAMLLLFQYFKRNIFDQINSLYLTYIGFSSGFLLVLSALIFNISSYEYIASSALLGGFSFLLIVIIVAELMIGKRFTQANTERQINQLVHLSNRNLTNQIDEMRLHYQTLEQVNHDRQNHFLAIQQLLQAGQTEEADEYVNTLLGMVAPLHAEICSGSPLLDAFIAAKIKQAKKQGIEFELALDMPKQTDIDLVDLCVIVGNLLDNAIEASKAEPQRRFIEIVLKQKQNFLCIKLANFSLVNPMLQNPKLTTTKSNGDEVHGVGLQSVRASVEKYSGHISFAYENNIFTAMVTLENKKFEDKK